MQATKANKGLIISVITGAYKCSWRSRRVDEAQAHPPNVSIMVEPLCLLHPATLDFRLRLPSRRRGYQKGHQATGMTAQGLPRRPKDGPR